MSDSANLTKFALPQIVNCVVAAHNETHSKLDTLAAAHKERCLLRSSNQTNNYNNKINSINNTGGSSDNNDNSAEDVVEVTPTTRTAAIASADSTQALSEGRQCWICLHSDDEDNMAAWVHPCKCCGTTKWVHQYCLSRWVDVQQNGNPRTLVLCTQCQTPYIIVVPKVNKIVSLLEFVDYLIHIVSPFLAAGIFVASVYWAAVMFGVLTAMQVMGPKRGVEFLKTCRAPMRLVGFPMIPVLLLLGRNFHWENALLSSLRNRRGLCNIFCSMTHFFVHGEPDNDQRAENISVPLSDCLTATRFFCGAMLLPTISCVGGQLFSQLIENTLYRTLIGGLAFTILKGLIKMYMKKQRQIRTKNRRVVDYTDENLRNFVL